MRVCVRYYIWFCGSRILEIVAILCEVWGFKNTTSSAENYPISAAIKTFPNGWKLTEVVKRASEIVLVYRSVVTLRIGFDLMIIFFSRPLKSNYVRRIYFAQPRNCPNVKHECLSVRVCPF